VQVHCDEGVAAHIGPKPCAGIREDIGEASAGERAGQPGANRLARFVVMGITVTLARIGQAANALSTGSMGVEARYGPQSAPGARTGVLDRRGRLVCSRCG
jgi:hypothetical protein